MLDSLRQIVQDVNSAPNIPTALRTVVRQARKVLGVDACSVYFTEQDRHRHIIVATDGLSPGVVGQVQFGFGKGLIGRVAERTEPLNLEQVPAHLDEGFLAQTGADPYHGFLGVPVTHRGRVLGVLVVRQRAARRFEEADVAFLATLAAQLGGAIAYAKMSSDLCSLCDGQDAEERYLEGLTGASGAGIGVGVVIFPPRDLATVPDRRPLCPDQEEAALRGALQALGNELEQLKSGLKEKFPAADRALFDAYAMLLQSPELVESTVERIHAGNWAPGALRQTIELHAQRFENIEDPYLRERAADIRELGACILAHLQQAAVSVIEYPPQTVLVGSQIGAIDVVRVPPGRLVGLLSAEGSPASHATILARSLGIPAIVGMGKLPLVRLEGQELLVNGYQGRVYIRPGPVLRAQLEGLACKERVLSRDLEVLRDLPATTSDGTEVRLYTNAGLRSDTNACLAAGAAGIGLYRTELQFMLNDRFPTESEQTALYREVLEALAPRPVTLRTLDLGGDKPLSYFPVQETNPMLGWRGIRMTLDHPEIFLTQIRAALRAAAGVGNLRLMFPMITGIPEVEETCELVDRAHRQLLEEGVSVQQPPLGLMVEVPAAVHQAQELAQRVDFLAVGTNDLAQYLLAVDRGNRQVARLFDPLHPAVLRALVQVLEAAKCAGKPVSACGEAAGEPLGALLFVGMGFDGLSVSAASLPRVKWLIRSIERTRAQELAKVALNYDRPEPVRRLLTEALNDFGLSRLVPAVGNLR